MARYAQGFYQLKNPKKYIGTNKPKYRSGWELTFMMFCDNNEKILQWASESIHIPYRNPFDGRHTIYIPDFFIMYQDQQGRKIAELIEIKPKKQTIIEEKVTNARDRAAVVLNYAKWQAATAWCKQHGISFRVVTEDQIFHNGRR